MAYTDVPRESVTVNVRKAVFAVLNTETDGTYGDVRPICKNGLMSVKASTKTESESVYGDGGLRDVSSDMGASSVEMEINSLTSKDDALMHGHKYVEEKKTMLVKSSDIAPYIATGFAIEKFDGTVNAYWYPLSSSTRWGAPSSPTRSTPCSSSAGTTPTCPPTN